MKRITILLFLSVFCFTAAMQAQAPAPAPKVDPALKKLHVWVGHWTYEGEYQASPLGPGGKATGDWRGQMVLGGFFLQGQLTEKGAAGETRILYIAGYDPVNKNFPTQLYYGDGSRFSGVLTIAGNTRTYEGKWSVAGKQYQLKVSFMLGPDLTSETEKAEFSADGKTWTPFLEAEWTKTKPPAKK
jgi:hypothetical protein